MAYADNKCLHAYTTIRHRVRTIPRSNWYTIHYTQQFW